MLEVQNLTKRFKTITAVDDVDYEISEGATNSIIGPNGAGKTTFFNLLSGTFPPTKGRVFFKGEDITEFGPVETNRKGIGRSFQVVNLFNELTVLENIRIGIQSSNRNPWSLEYTLASVDNNRGLNKQAEKIAEQVGLGDVLTKEVSELAYGQKRNLEIGVTVSTGAELLLFDEPAAGLTTHETDALMSTINTVAKGKTVLIIEHDMEFVMGISDEVTVLHQGSILASGTPEKIKQNTKVQQVYLGNT